MLLPTSLGQNMAEHGHLDQHAQQFLDTFYTQSLALFNHGHGNPKIIWDVTGTTAGKALYQRNQISLNLAIFTREPLSALRETIGHELAHLIVYWLHPNQAKPHGVEWQQTMRMLGLVPQRCHQFAVDDLKRRHIKRFTYVCACKEHLLTSIRHNKIRRGQTLYSCRGCGEALREKY